jgi:hypothetical protein
VPDPVPEDRRGESGDDERGGTRRDRRRQGQARERQRGRQPDDGDQQAQDEGARDAGERRDQRGRADPGQGAPGEPDRPGGHGQRHERHDREVRQRGERRHATEGEQDDRERRRLRGERDTQALADPARQPSRPPLDRRRERRGPGDQAGGGGGRKLEADVRGVGRCGEDQETDRPAERGGRGARAAALARQQGHAGHRRRPHHRGRRPGQHGVPDDCHEDRARARPASAAGEKGAHETRHERDVPAGDRDDVRHARGREHRRQVPVDTVAQADEDPGRQSGRRLGERPGEGIAPGTPDPFEQAGRIVGSRDDHEVGRPKGPGDADPAQVVPVAALGRWLRASVEADADSGLHDRVAGGGHGEGDPRRLHEGNR